MTMRMGYICSLQNKIGRLLHIIVALFLLLLLLPLFLIIACLIKGESVGPVFFKQQRVGKNEKPFAMYKFRSMYVHQQTPEQLGLIKHNHALVTHIGYFLRRFKLDELPQIINILLGSMSFIGPRPCLLSRLDTMSEREKRRFHVMPGMTGWAEVNGNVELDWDEQLMLDLWYVDNKTMLLDSRIYVKTILIVLFGSVKNQKAIQQAKNFINK